jgi:hypothetical protein
MPGVGARRTGDASRVGNEIARAGGGSTRLPGRVGQKLRAIAGACLEYRAETKLGDRAPYRAARRTLASATHSSRNSLSRSPIVIRTPPPRLPLDGRSKAGRRSARRCGLDSKSSSAFRPALSSSRGRAESCCPNAITLCPLRVVWATRERR